MTRWTGVLGAVTTTVAASVLVLLAAQGAQAAEPRATHLCSTYAWGTPRSASISGATFEGDLVADVSCWVSDSRVSGDVLVLPGTALWLDGATVAGDVRTTGGPNELTSWVDTRDSDLHGDLTVARSGTLRSTTVRGDVVAAGAPADSLVLEDVRVLGGVAGTVGGLTLDRTAVVGPVDVTTWDATRVRASAVGADLTARRGRLLVHDSVVRGTLTAAGPSDLLVCRTQVDGDLAVSGVRVWGRVGEERSAYCRTTVGGSAHVAGNPASVVLGDLHVAGDLVCAGNTGSLGVVRRSALVVGGTRSPGCT